MTKAVLLEDPHQVADEVFSGFNIEVERIKGSLDEDALIERLQDADIVGIRSKTHITSRVISSCPRLQVVGCFCIGTNQVDLEAATKRGVTIFNAPYSNTRSVVELAIGHIINLARHIETRNQDLQRGIWNKSASGSHEVRGKTLGIIGYGNIGTQLSVLAEAMGMNVVFYDCAQRLAMGNARALPTMDEVLKTADFISVHVDGRKSNEGLIGKRQFELMKEGAIFINLSRGLVVDVDALAENIRSGKISGAAVDVYPEEPKKNGNEFHSPLLGLPNTILTPHIGGSTLEAQFDIGQFVSHKIADYWRLGSTEMSVNMPNLNLSTHDNSLYRLAFLHRNIPGVLGRVNQVFADQNVNINGQLLGTEGEVGYALTDIASELPVSAVAQIRSLPEAIGLRVLSLN
ncbi:phosphoglycerate dehydrogenase [Varibaculum massiliense]|uniref:phosphoglycerate dehydrogenase n=1 Tax=Varibaculum massiliense TaxID=1852372 RepID=UPI0008DA694B|nr:phosphoglycerate dehydrogenase [Varibaculum massiliense]